MSRDPLGLWGDPAQRGNGQSYCGNDPVNLVDPFGDLSPSHGPGKELGDLGPGGRSGPELRWDVWKMLEKVREAADEDPSLAQLILEITTVLIAEGLIGLGAETIGKIPALIAELLQSEGGCDVGLAIVGRIPGVSAGKRAGRAAKIVAELVERYREAKKRFRSRVRSSGAPQGPPASGPPTAPPPSTPPPSGPPGGGGPPPTPPSGGPPSAPPPTPGTPGDPDFENQKALRDLVNSETNRGHKPLSREDAETVLDWADEVDYPGRRASPGDVGFPSNWNGGKGQPHIHLPGAGRGGHVPVDPGVQPR